MGDLLEMAWPHKEHQASGSGINDDAQHFLEKKSSLLNSGRTPECLQPCVQQLGLPGQYLKMQRLFRVPELFPQQQQLTLCLVFPLKIPLLERVAEVGLYGH